MPTITDMNNNNSPTEGGRLKSQCWPLRCPKTPINHGLQDKSVDPRARARACMRAHYAIQNSCTAKRYLGGVFAAASHAARSTKKGQATALLQL